MTILEATFSGCPRVPCSLEACDSNKDVEGGGTPQGLSPLRPVLLRDMVPCEEGVLIQGRGQDGGGTQD